LVTVIKPQQTHVNRTWQHQIYKCYKVATTTGNIHSCRLVFSWGIFGGILQPQNSVFIVVSHV